MWEEGLAIHPDRVYTDYITDGITQGFRTRFHYTCQLGEAKHNNYVVSKAESSGSGWLPKSRSPVGQGSRDWPRGAGTNHSCYSAIGVIPNKHKPGKCVKMLLNFITLRGKTTLKMAWFTVNAWNVDDCTHTHSHTPIHWYIGEHAQGSLSCSWNPLTHLLPLELNVIYPLAI